MLFSNTARIGKKGSRVHYICQARFNRGGGLWGGVVGDPRNSKSRERLKGHFHPLFQNCSLRAVLNQSCRPAKSVCDSTQIATLSAAFGRASSETRPTHSRYISWDITPLFSSRCKCEPAWWHFHKAESGVRSMRLGSGSWWDTSGVTRVPTPFDVMFTRS